MEKGAERYIFNSAESERERNRLRTIESIFDPASRRRLWQVGIKKGNRCLEVGAGAGSMTRWLARRVGPSGHVKAVDINTRYLDRSFPNVTVVEADIRNMVLQPNSFDVIHTRYVLVHIPEYAKVLNSLWAALKPGGGMVIEEPDFTAYRGFSGPHMDSFNKVHRAILKMFSDKGVNSALGAQLPALFQKRGAKFLAVDYDAPISQGGAAISEMMNLSAIQLREKYLATGQVSARDLVAYGRFTQNPATWAIYYATVGAMARK